MKRSPGPFAQSPFAGFKTLHPSAWLLITPDARALLAERNALPTQRWTPWRPQPETPPPALPRGAVPVLVACADEAPRLPAAPAARLLLAPEPSAGVGSAAARWAGRLKRFATRSEAWCAATGLAYRAVDTPDRMRLALWLVAGASLILFAGRFLPPDDALRHSIAYLFNYDLGKLYAHWQTPLTTSPNWFFEAPAGWLHKVLTAAGWQEYTATVLAIGGFVLFAWSFLRWIPSRDSSYRALLLALVLAALSLRPYLGRPTTYLTGLFLLGIHPSVARSWRRALAVGLLCVALYWIYFVYLPPMGLFHPVYWALMPAAHAFWDRFLDGRFTTIIQSFVAAVYRTGHGAWSASEATIPVGENLSLANLGTLSWAIVLVAAGLFVQRAARAWKGRPRAQRAGPVERIRALWRFAHSEALFLAAAWFMASNQMRYMDFFLPLCVLYAEPFWRRVLSNGLPHKPWRAAAACVLLAAFSLRPSQLLSVTAVHNRRPPEALLERLEGKRVLSASSTPLFALVYFAYPDHPVRVSPFDARFNPPEVVRALASTHRTGHAVPRTALPPCSVYARYPYDFVLVSAADSFTYPAPSCYRLEGVYGDVAVWRVTTTTPSLASKERP